ncbi:MAG: class I SAM-dependent methyltransferase [bacterium]
MDRVYDHPRYYELAFAWRDIPAEAKVMDECIARYSRIPGATVLELACGNAPHLLEWLDRSRRYVGLDRNEAMLAYVAEKARRAGATVQLVRGELARFELPEPVDFACIMLGSLYVTSTAELVSHFDSVAAALRPGGLYLLDWCIHTWAKSDPQETWDMEADGLWIRTTWSERSENVMEQTYRERIELEVKDRGKRSTIVQESIRRAIHPQEFRIFIAGRPDFEFVGWWHDWDLARPLNATGEIRRPIIVVRRR